MELSFSVAYDVGEPGKFSFQGKTDISCYNKMVVLHLVVAGIYHIFIIGQKNGSFSNASSIYEFN
jgi:hypothetical protein